MAVPETASRPIARRRIVFTQVPRLVAESLGLALARRGFEIVVSPDGPVAGGCGPPLDEADPSHDVVEVVGLLGQDLSGWHRLTWDPLGRVGTVVLTDRCDVGLYLQAYRMGAALAHLSASPDSVVDVIEARARGEILAPASLLSGCLRQQSATLTDIERVVLRHLAEGRTVAQAAEASFYSERHVRRILHATMTKAGTRDRRKVIEFFATEIALHREGRRFNQGDIRDPKFSNQDIVMAAEDSALS